MLEKIDSAAAAAAAAVYNTDDDDDVRSAAGEFDFEIGRIEQRRPIVERTFLWRLWPFFRRAGVENDVTFLTWGRGKNIRPQPRSSKKGLNRVEERESEGKGFLGGASKASSSRRRS